MSNYNTNIVKKPWGYEYLAYENKHVALWFLYIKHTHSTSLHCHPSKTTGLILLDGKAEISFLNDTNKLENGAAVNNYRNKALEIFEFKGAKLPYSKQTHTTIMRMA